MLVYFLISMASYLLISLVTARVAYGIERSRIIAEERDWHSDQDPLRHFDDQGRSGTAVLSGVYGLAWPVVIPVYLCCRAAALVITSRPPRSRYERTLRARALHHRIRELEESLEMRDHDPVGRRGSI